MYQDQYKTVNMFEVFLWLVQGLSHWKHDCASFSVEVWRRPGSVFKGGLHVALGQFYFVL